MQFLVPYRPTNRKLTLTNLAALWYRDSCGLDFYGLRMLFRVFLILFSIFVLGIIFLVLSLMLVLLRITFLPLWLHSTHWLKPERLTVIALVDLAIAQNGLVALDGTLAHTNKEAYVKVDRQTEEGLDNATVAIGHLGDHVENHAEGKLVAVFVW